uniref:FHA domain-containing protein n=1 Tax=Picea sitchensis TaxID=3332 RepID=A9NQC3_PICSI|nr:unknown [Picea sitchensis]
MQALIAPTHARGLSYLPRLETPFTSVDISFKPLNPTFSIPYSQIQSIHVKSSAGKRIKVESRSIDRLHPIRASASQPSGGTDKWVFEFVGDGDSSHIGQAVSPPKAFELTLDVATVGRLPEKADIVIPVATVSGIHARLERKEGILFVSDMNSTNGTYIDNTRLSPGAVTALSAGSCITFESKSHDMVIDCITCYSFESLPSFILGDINLATFRFSKEKGIDSSIEGTSLDQATNLSNQG